MNTTIKKQNRILLAALIVILAAAAVLIAVTGGANKKEANPPLSETSSAEETAAPKEKEQKEKNTLKSPAADESRSGHLPGEETGTVGETDPEKKDAADPEAADEDVASMLEADDTLPTFAVPVDNFVIKDYSADVPVFSCTMDDYRIHSGVDIACSTGTPVFSAADGFVCELVSDPMMGVTVGIQHSGGAVTRYKGLAEESMDLLKPGDEITCGQVIGASGETALIESAEEAHVHFELSINGEVVDPGDYMKLRYLSDIYEG